VLTKNLVMVVGELVVSAIDLKEPKPENVHKIKCPGCNKRETFIPICDIIQQGFFENDCRTVFQCQNCTFQGYVRYQVPVYQVVENEDEHNAAN